VRKNQKIQLVSNLNDTLSANSIAIVFHYHGLTVAAITELRRKIRASSGHMKIAKNKLVKIAIKDTEFDCLEQFLTGPIAIAYSNDPAFVKAISEFAKSNEALKIVGGALNGKALNAQGVKVLATLPSLDELRAKIIGTINAPATKIAGVLNAVPSQIARVVNAYATK